MKSIRTALALDPNHAEANRLFETHETALKKEQADQQRRLDRTRTTWVGAAVGAVAVASTVAILNGSGKSKGSVPKPVDPPESRAPVLPGTTAP